jgi:glycosyltransferase involved in cell wall biosynthesis
LEPSIRRLIAGEHAAVELLGHRSDIPELMAEAWAVVLFSDHEGVPFSLEEAMWGGRAVVASPVPGIRWLVGDDRQLAGNVAGAATAMRLLSTRETATAIGTSNAGRVRDLLTADDPWPDLERRYR